MLGRAGVDEAGQLNAGQFNRVMTEVLMKKNAAPTSHVLLQNIDLLDF
jgi:hypothetical protein